MSGLHSQSSILPRFFYERSPPVVARQLLGKLLIRRLGGRSLVGRITETEAYLGQSDPASHAYRGKSPYNAVLFGPAGHTDVYLIYGLHYCMNVSCLPEGRAGGVLIRGLEPIEGIATMARLRGLPLVSSARQLTGGPGRVCQALKIERPQEHDLDVTDSTSTIQVHDDGHKVGTIVTTRRIGVSKAIDRPLRFVVGRIP